MHDNNWDSGGASLRLFFNGLSGKRSMAVNILIDDVNMQL